MGKARVAGAKRPIGWLGWTIRILGGTVLTVALALAGYVIYFTLAVYPKLVAEGTAKAQKAEAFARLTGTARRLAIYDAFVAQIDSQYYDQTFAGMDWPKMKHDWRIKASSVATDNSLYSDVLFQMAQQFPTSHFAVIWPALPPHTDAAQSAKGSGTEQKFGGEKDLGFQASQLRRRGRTTWIVGEVWPNSAAAKAGVTPGWIIDESTFNVKDGHAHITAKFMRLNAAQMHSYETVGSAELFKPDQSLTQSEMNAKVDSLKVKVDYDVKFGGPEPDFITKRLPNGILYIRFDHFEEAVMKKVVGALNTAGEKGVILDLRYNVGGHTMLLLNAILPGNTSVYKRRNARGLYTVFTDSGTRPYLGSLAVLTGPTSASAAEITASVLKFKRRAIIVGRNTNGSVLAAGVFPLPDGGQVEVPVEDVETLDGKRLENIGVSPDIEIYPTLESIRAGRDQALEAAETYLLKH